MANTETLDTWAIMEILGYRKLAGKVSEAKIAGAPFIRIDIPQKDGKDYSQFYSPQSIYAITPTTEEIAKQFALAHEIKPVQRYELQLTMGQPEDDDRDEKFPG